MLQRVQITQVYVQASLPLRLVMPRSGGRCMVLKWRILRFKVRESTFRADKVHLLKSVGGIVSGYNAGQAIGGLSAGYLADRFSRKYAIGIACVISEY